MNNGQNGETQPKIEKFPDNESDRQQTIPTSGSSVPEISNGILRFNTI